MFPSVSEVVPSWDSIAILWGAADAAVRLTFNVDDCSPPSMDSSTAARAKILGEHKPKVRGLVCFLRLCVACVPVSLF